MNVESRQEPKFKVGYKITNGKGIFTIVTLSSDKYIVEDSFGRYGFLHFKNQDKWKILEEEDLDLKFKVGDRVFNKMTRKWVNIIEFDLETGLYIVRYDDGIQGRSLESELCEGMETKPVPKFKVGDRIYSKYHKPSNDLEIIEVIRGDGHYGYRIKNHQINNTYFMWEYDMSNYKFAEEETKSHNNICKQLIDEMNPNVEVNVKTKPKLKFKVGDIIAKVHLRFRIVKVESDRYIVEERPGIYLEIFFTDQDKYRLIKEEGITITTVDKAAEVFAEMLVELCPELLGFGGAAKEWENEFRKRLEE